jgi:hypothetical protein
MPRKKELKGEITRITFTVTKKADRKLTRAAEKAGCTKSEALRQLIDSL